MTAGDTMTKPTLGRIVHYVASSYDDVLYRGATHAAIITEVIDDAVVTVTVFCPTGVTVARSALLSDVPTPGQAHWPPR